MPFNYIVRKSTAGYKISKSQEKIPLDVHGQHKTFCGKQTKIGNLQQTENIQSRYRNGIWLRKMHHASNKKCQTTHYRRSRRSKSSSHQNARRKGNLQIPGNIES